AEDRRRALGHRRPVRPEAAGGFAARPLARAVEPRLSPARARSRENRHEARRPQAALERGAPVPEEAGVNLVVQGPEVETPDLKRIATIAKGGSIERISAEAFRVTQADPSARTAVAEHCAKARLDWGYVAEGRRFGD